MKTNIVSQTSMTGKSYTSVISKKRLVEDFANKSMEQFSEHGITCLLYTSPSPRD